MKATLEFTLPEEQYEFELAASASNLQARIDEALIHIRYRLKYEEGVSESVRQALEQVRTFLIEED